MSKAKAYLQNKLEKFSLEIDNIEIAYEYCFDPYKIRLGKLKNYPIPKNVPKAKENQITELVDQILSVKAEDPAADTQALEDQIDVLVYQLYGLTYEEVRIVDPDFEMSEVEYDGYSEKI